MREFIKSIVGKNNFSAIDVVALHVLPDVPYYAGLYETSANYLAKIVNVNHKTIVNFFDKLIQTNYVEVLRLKTVGRNAGIIFIRNDSKQGVLPFPTEKNRVDRYYVK